MSQSATTHFTACQKIFSTPEHKTHVDGTFYQKPSKFPCVLHDSMGCILLTEKHYAELTKQFTICESKGGAVHKINIKNKISRIFGYEICSQKSSCPKYRPRKQATASRG